jgi:Protein of unknown function (DUF1838)
MKYSALFLIGLALATWACNTTTQPKMSSSPAPTPPPSLNLDLSKPADNLQAFVKMRGSLDSSQEVVFYWTGTIYSFIPGERSQALYGMEAYNIAQVRPVSGGYEMLTREVALYTDLKTGKIMEKWYNPMTKDSNNVIHVWNDPVNQQMALKGRFGDWGVSWNQLGDNRLAMYSDIFLLYPSPLKKAEYPLNSRSDQYQAAELFQFFFNQNDMNDPQKKSIYAEVAWTRISDFLPWMNMADRPGYLVYQCRGQKLMNGAFDALPTRVKDYVMAKQPVFAKAPAKMTSPNMTSWRYFKQVLDAQKQ